MSDNEEVEQPDSQNDDPEISDNKEVEQPNSHNDYPEMSDDEEVGQPDSHNDDPEKSDNKEVGQADYHNDETEMSDDEEVDPLDSQATCLPDDLQTISSCAFRSSLGDVGREGFPQGIWFPSTSSVVDLTRSDVRGGALTPPRGNAFRKAGNSSTSSEDAKLSSLEYRGELDDALEDFRTHERRNQSSSRFGKRRGIEASSVRTKTSRVVDLSNVREST